MPDARPAMHLEEMDIATLRQGLEAGRWTTRALVEGYASRIEALDRGTHGLRSVLEVNPDALAIADACDAERTMGRTRGPLHGIPMLLKDNVDTADAMNTTAGSLALLGSRPTQDATIARKLRAAGAVLLGKTNMSEWANFRSTRSSSGWSGRGRQCRNPYVLDRSPGGSSSGSGVAVAASLCAAAIGTETNGSIVSPAAASGVVGLKPTVGLTSRAGVIPISHSQDTVGPLGRTVTDVAIVLGALVGPDPRDSATEASRNHLHADYTIFLDPDGLRGARIGVAREVYFGYSEHADAVVNAAIEMMRAAGATIVDPADIPTSRTVGESAIVRDVLLYEFKADLDAYLTERGDPRIRTLADAIAFNREHADAEMPYFRQELFEQAQAKGPLSDSAYCDALAANQRLSRADGLDAVLDRLELDALVAPTASPPVVIDEINGTHGLGSSSTPAALAGYPLLSMPAGYTPFGLPVNLSFMGRAWSEPTLLRLAYAFEQIGPPRWPPRYLPTLVLP
ncbi:MAG: amidase [Chloroflexi bacterium]|nr:amidase [Chloroflexota bacterium]